MTITEEKVSATLEAYCQAASWADGNDMEPSADFERTARRDVAEFLKLVALKGIDVEGRLDEVGHDFWLTRNRHGAGFWDGDWADDGDTLTELAHSFGETEFDPDLSDEDREMVEAFEGHFGHGEDLETIRDAYRGKWESPLAFVYELVDDLGMLDNVPEHCRLYFDYEAFCRDLFITDYCFENGHVFSTSW